MQSQFRYESVTASVFVAVGRIVSFYTVIHKSNSESLQDTVSLVYTCMKL